MLSKKLPCILLNKLLTVDQLWRDSTYIKIIVLFILLNANDMNFTLTIFKFGQYLKCENKYIKEHQMLDALLKLF